MIIRPRHQPTCALLDTPPIVQLWLLRLLVPLGAHRHFILSHGFSNDKLVELLGLSDWGDSTIEDFEPKLVRAELRQLQQASERKFRNTLAPTRLRRNIARLATLVGLSQIDCRILEFAVLIQNERILDETADGLGQLSSVKVFRALSVLLNLPEYEIRAALDAQAILTRSGLVAVDRSGSSTLRGKLDLLSDNFADKIVSSDTDPLSLLRDTVALSAPAQLKIADYDHITQALCVLRPYLKNAVETGRKGVNILLYGASGTGKTQLTKVLADELGCELFEVASEDYDGDPVKGELRLRAFRAAQSFFAQRQALILFDEMEDVFNDGDGFLGRKSTAQTRKAWINRMLEENLLPTLWLSNSIQGLDPAFMRRFDMVFELPVPPKQQRERILLTACADLLDAPSVARIAESQALAPAVVTRVAAVVRSIRHELGALGAATAFELLIDNTLEAQGHPALRKNDANSLAEIYDPRFIHADADLALVARGLGQSKAGRLCLYGPAGTGKTAYARWLAEQLSVPLVVKRASDLMSKWLGGNEKNIACAFKQAQQEGALLLMDEVDSFLQDRRTAQRGWELSLVNEMLTQMESFSGVFIATTNLMHGLDQAALRRFDLKVKFDFLKPEQASELLRRYCAALSIAPPEPEQLTRLVRIPKLTPGDFAAVMRQHRFRPLASSADWVGALAADCALKENAVSAIGFMH